MLFRPTVRIKFYGALIAFDENILIIFSLCIDKMLLAELATEASGFLILSFVYCDCFKGCCYLD